MKIGEIFITKGMILMDKSTEELGQKIYSDLKKDYVSVEKIVMKDENIFCVYAEDDTLWKIFEDMINEFRSIEFDSGTGESPFLRIII
jgi:Ribonuclease G/E